MLYFFICLLHPGNVKKKNLKLCLKTKQAAPHHCCPWALPRSCGGQRPGGHFPADANRVQREVRSREKPEAAAPRAAWDLHLRLGRGLSVSEPGTGGMQGGGRRGDAAWSGPKTGNPRNIRLVCMFTSFLCRFLPSVLQHLTFYFCIGKNCFSGRSGVIPLLLEEARAEPVRELGVTLRFTCGKLFLGPSQLAKNKRCSVYK